MKKKESFYAVGPAIVIRGKKKIKRIRRAIQELGANAREFEIGWQFSANPGDNDETRFWLLTKDVENVKFLPVNFAEIITESLAKDEPEKKE